MTSLCIDFGGTVIKIGLLDCSQVIARRALPSFGLETDLAAVSAAAHSLLAGTDSSPVTGVGIAMPGVVDQVRGCLVAAHDKYGYALGMDIRTWAGNEFGAPVAIENDARAALIGETQYGCAVGEQDVVLIILGTGVGTAALIEGRVLRGAHDHAGILGGHTTIQLAGPPCNCGNIGCAEAIASTWALERAVRAHPRLAASSWWTTRLTRGHLGIKDLLDSQDDGVSRDILDVFIGAWGAAISGLCNSYDPEVVIVSGGVMRSADALLPRLEAAAVAHLWPSAHRPRFVTPAGPEHSVLLGLSVLATQAAEENRHL
jgi:glucokinase